MLIYVIIDSASALENLSLRYKNTIEQLINAPDALESKAMQRKLIMAELIAEISVDKISPKYFYTSFLTDKLKPGIAIVFEVPYQYENILRVAGSSGIALSVEEVFGKDAKLFANPQGYWTQLSDSSESKYVSYSNLLDEVSHVKMENPQNKDRSCVPGSLITGILCCGIFGLVGMFNSRKKEETQPLLENNSTSSLGYGKK